MLQVIDIYRTERPREGRQEQRAHHLHRALCPSWTPLKWDVRTDPRLTQALEASPLAPSTSYIHVPTALSQPALSSYSSRLCIISREFPCIINISLPPPRAVTCGDVLVEIYSSLQAELEDTEWVLVDGRRRREIKQANMTRRKSGAPLNIQRVDYLAENIYFLGLIKDDVYVKTRLMPGSKTLLSDTWVAVFGMIRR